MKEPKDLFDTDWESLLEPNEKAVRQEGKDQIPVVLLSGLQRLARMANMLNQNVIIQTPSDRMVQAIFSASFCVNGTVVNFVGAADANSNNTKGVFAAFPTAVAESRAEARCLRKALGIRMLSAEEVGFREGVASLETSPSGKADKQLTVAIEKLCENKGVNIAQVLEEVIEDKARASSIFELSELTVIEAQKAMGWLNEQKQKPVSTKELRDARKAELEAKKST